MALRRSEMKPGRPLQSRARLARRTPLLARKNRSDRLPCGSLRIHDEHLWVGQTTALRFWCAGVKPRKRATVPDRVRKALRQRSGGLCEMRLVGCWGRATDLCHRIASGAGGRHGQAKVDHDRLSNAIHACRACHAWSEAHPAESYRLGLMVREGGVPERVPVLLPGRGPMRVLLDNVGGHTQVRGAAA